MVLGGDGADELYGGGGNDSITGGQRTDTLTGDSGADTFIFNDASDSAFGDANEITYFQSGTDVIDLSAIDTDTTMPGDQAFTIGGSGASALWLVGGSVFGDVDGDGVADFEIKVELSLLQADDIVL